MHLFEYLRNYLRAHKKKVTKLGKKVAYHANCATRLIPEYEDFLDEVFELVGVERPDREYERLNAVCCTAPLIYVNRELAVDIQKRNFEDGHRLRCRCHHNFLPSMSESAYATQLAVQSTQHIHH
jgi:Fe-S oxidoreductase